MKVHWINRYVTSNWPERNGYVITACGRRKDYPQVVVKFLRTGRSIWEDIIPSHRCKICQRAYLQAKEQSK